MGLVIGLLHFNFSNSMAMIIVLELFFVIQDFYLCTLSFKTIEPGFSAFLELRYFFGYFFPFTDIEGSITDAGLIKNLKTEGLKVGAFENSLFLFLVTITLVLLSILFYSAHFISSLNNSSEKGQTESEDSQG